MPETASSATSSQLFDLNRQLGILEERVRSQDTRVSKFGVDLENVQKEASKALGFISGAKWAAGIFLLLLAGLGTLFWAVLGTKISTLFMMAEDRQVAERQAPQITSPTRTPGSDPKH